MGTFCISNLAEKKLSEEISWEGSLFKIVRRVAELPDGRIASRDIVRRHSQGVAVVAIDDAGRICLVQQYRNPLESLTIELPAGLLDKDESPIEGAKRELAEETGASAEHFEHLVTMVSSPGFTDETVDIFLATGLSLDKAHPDEGEFIDAAFFEFEEALRGVLTNDIVDAKTIVGILLAAHHLGK